MRAVTTMLLFLNYAVMAQTASDRPKSVSDCTLITDPTLLNACIESFKAKGRPAGVRHPILDPTTAAQIRPFGSPFPSMARGKKHPKSTAPAGAASDSQPPAEMP